VECLYFRSHENFLTPLVALPYVSPESSWPTFREVSREGLSFMGQENNSINSYEPSTF
jgi:hypothetical protein